MREPMSTFAEHFEVRLAGGKPQMPRQMCPEPRVSAERVRQMLIMHWLGQRQIAAGETDRANARLLLYPEETLRLQELRSLERMVAFARSELSCLPLQTHGLLLLV